MKTEKPVEYSTDHFTVIPYNGIQYKIVITFLILFCIGLMGAWIDYVSQRITDYEKYYNEYGALLGVFMALSVKMISLALSDIPEDEKYQHKHLSPTIELLSFVQYTIIKRLKYRCKNFSLFELRELSMFMMSVLNLDTWLCMTEEDFIMIYGHKCPLQKLMFAIIRSFIGVIVIIEFLVWSILDRK